MKISVAIALTVFAWGAVSAQSVTPPPLCVIDGVKMQGGCAEVWKSSSHLDIESVEVLKGPSAERLYGSDAANGVILITTKRVGALPADDPLARFLFSPELVMAHQQEISLTDTQRQAIQGAMRDAQRKFVDLQFQMSAEVEKLQHAVQTPAPDEAKVMEQLDRVLAAERDVKHAQLSLMVRIKNQLTEQQQAALAKLR